MIPAWLLQLIEAVCYSASKGWWKAWFELQQRGTHAFDEEPTDEDKRRADNFRAAVAGDRVQSGPPVAGPPSPPPTGGTG